MTAYFGAGAGIAFANSELSLSIPGTSKSYDDSEMIFVYQFEAGLRYLLSLNWTLNGGVRYIGYSDPEFDYEGASFSPAGLDAFALDFGFSYWF